MTVGSKISNRDCGGLMTERFLPIRDHVALLYLYLCLFRRRAAWGSVPIRDGALHLRAGQRPVVIQIGDHLSHEWLGERDRAIFVAEMIVENGKSQLLRARAFVGPLEAPFGELLNFVMLGQPTAIHCDFKTVDVACSLIGLH